MKTLSFINQKGGVSKTTSVVNVACAINKIAKEKNREIKVLVVDIDPQGNCSNTLFHETIGSDGTISRLFEQDFYEEGSIVHDTRFENIRILPSNITLGEKEFVAANLLKAHERLSLYLKEIQGDYDICILDCPPSLGLFSLNALVASDYMLIPTTLEKYSIDGIKDLFKTVKTIKKVNNKLKVLGILPVMVDNRYKIHKILKEEMKIRFEEYFLEDLSISTNAPLKNAVAQHKTIFEYDYNASTYKQYLKLANWLLKEVGIDETK
jgi:chromosome partitioning protein